jgi:hypothetical protein
MKLYHFNYLLFLGMLYMAGTDLASGSTSTEDDATSHQQKRSLTDIKGDENDTPRATHHPQGNQLENEPFNFEADTGKPTKRRLKF